MGASDQVTDPPLTKILCNVCDERDAAREEVNMLRKRVDDLEEEVLRAQDTRLRPVGPMQAEHELRTRLDHVAEASPHLVAAVEAHLDKCSLTELPEYMGVFRRSGDGTALHRQVTHAWAAFMGTQFDKWGNIPDQAGNKVVVGLHDCQVSG